MKKVFFSPINQISGVVALLCIVFILRAPIGTSIGNNFFGSGPWYNLSLARDAYAFADIWNDPQPKLAYARGRVAFIAGDLERALWFFEQEEKYFPDTDQTYYMQGLTLGFLGREYEGIEAFLTFIQKHPESWAARNDLAWLYFRIGALEEARRVIEPVVQSYAGTPWVENTYGVILLNQGKYTEAHDAFMRGYATLDMMSPEEWGLAYPGNDPRIYMRGLSEMKLSFQNNLARTEELLMEASSSPSAHETSRKGSHVIP